MVAARRSDEMVRRPYADFGGVCMPCAASWKSSAFPADSALWDVAIIGRLTVPEVPMERDARPVGFADRARSWSCGVAEGDARRIFLSSTACCGLNDSCRLLTKQGRVRKYPVELYKLTVQYYLLRLWGYDV